MDVSKASLYEHSQQRNGEDQTSTSKIFRIIKDMAQRAADEGDDEEMGELAMMDVRNRVIAKGFTEMQLMETILEVSLSWCFHSWTKLTQAVQYENMDVLMRTANGSRLQFVTV